LAGGALATLLTAAPAEAQSPEAQIALWRNIRDSGKAELFADFSKRFPDSPLARLALLRFEALTGERKEEASGAVALPALAVLEPRSFAEGLAEPTFESLAARRPVLIKQTGNMRSGPGTGNSIIAKVEAGQAYLPIQENGD
jgi:hypothetical protein